MADIASTSALLGVNLEATLFTGNNYYMQMVNWYKFYYWACKGHPHTVDRIPNYLPQHPREPDAIWEARKKRIFPVNFTRSVVKKTVGAVWSQAVVRKGLTNESDEQMFLYNCNLFGMCLDKFMKQAIKAAYVQGFSAILVDALPPGTPASLNYSSNRGSYPYVVLFDAINVMDWRFGKNKDLDYIVLREVADEFVYTGNTQPVNLSSIQFLVVTRTKIYRVYQQVRQSSKIDDPAVKVNIEEYDHVLSRYNQVPIVLVAPDDIPNPFYAESGVSEISKIDQAIVNYLNLRDDIYYSQAFGQLIIQADSEEEIKELQVGVSIALRYPKESNAPMYIAPPPDAVNGINAGIEQAVMHIQRLADQRFGSNDASGTSKAWDYHDEEFSVIEIAKIAQTAENMIWRILQLSDGSLDIDAEQTIIAQYSDAFDMRGAREFIDDFTALSVAVQLPPRAITVGTQQSIDKLFKDKLDEDDRDVIIKQLEDAEKLNIEIGGATGLMLPGLDPTKATRQMQGIQDNNNQNIAAATAVPVDNRAAVKTSKSLSDRISANM